MELLTDKQKAELAALHNNVVYMERETLERLLVEQYRLSFELKSALDEAMAQLEDAKKLLMVVKLMGVRGNE